MTERRPPGNGAVNETGDEDGMLGEEDPDVGVGDEEVTPTNEEGKTKKNK